MSKKIFLSCLNEQATNDLINKIIIELKQNQYEIINESSMFDQNDIKDCEKLIDLSDWIIIFITKKSVERDSWCLQQLQYAIDTKKNILPILIEEKAKVPSAILRTQWVPFTRTIKDGKFDEEYFNIRIKEISDVLSGVKNELVPYKVFISYGHDKYADKVIKKIAKDLEREGLKPWIDYDYLYGSFDWEFKIEDGIDGAPWVIFFITEHSMKRPDGYCLKEITYSRSKGKKIIPVFIQNIDVPISIIERPQIDFSKSIDHEQIINNEEYNKSFQRICDILNNKYIFRIDDSLKTELNPLDNTSDLKSNPSYFGREWLEQKFEEWLHDDKSKVFYLIGSAGSGKSQFISHLSDKNPHIHAVHFCKYDDSERSNPKRVIMSLAYHLARQIPKYRDLLLQELELNKDLMQKSVAYIFNLLFIDVLNNIDYDPKEKDSDGKEKGPIVIVIDALDEAISESDDVTGGTMRNQLLKLINENFRLSTPSWLKLLITSRPDINVEARLRSLNPLKIEASSQLNINDINGYLAKELQPYIEQMSDNKKSEIINTITKKSQGSFIYASKVIEDLALGISDIKDYEKFPNGLGEKYLQYFDRLFPDINVFENDFKPLLNILAAQYEPINKTGLMELLNINNDKFIYIKNHLSSLFTFNQDTGAIQPFHKSLIDYLTGDIASYHISKFDGHKLITDNLYSKYKNNNIDDYGIKHLAQHCLETNDIEKTLEILKDKNIIEQRIKLMGAGIALNQYFDEIHKLYCVNNDKILELFHSDTFIYVFSEYRNILNNEGLYNILSKCGFDKIIEECDAFKVTFEYLISCEYYLLANDKIILASRIKWQGQRPDNMELRRRRMQYKNKPDVRAERELNNAILYMKSGTLAHVYNFCSVCELIFNDHLGKKIEPNAVDYLSNATNCLVLAKACNVAANFLSYLLYHDYSKEYYLYSIKLVEKSKTLTNNKDIQKNIEWLLVQYKSSNYLDSIWKMDDSNKEQILKESLEFVNQYSNNIRFKNNFSTYTYLDLILHICLGDVNYIQDFEYYRNLVHNNDSLYQSAFCYCLKCLLNKEYDKANECLKNVLQQNKTENKLNIFLLMPIIGRLSNNNDPLDMNGIFNWFKTNNCFSAIIPNNIDEFKDGFSEFVLKWIKFHDSFIAKILTNTKKK